MNNLLDHVLENVDDGDMVRITSHNEVNQNDKPRGLFQAEGPVIGKCNREHV